MVTKKKAKGEVEINPTKNVAVNEEKSKRIYKSRGKKEIPMEEEKDTTIVSSKQTRKKDLHEVVDPVPAKENKTQKVKDKSSPKARSTSVKAITKKSSKDKNKDKEPNLEFFKPKETTKTTTKKTKMRVEKELQEIIEKTESKKTKKATPKTKEIKDSKVEVKAKKETKKTKTKKADKTQESISEDTQKPKPQVRYSDEDLEIFRKRILEVKREALEELNMLRDRLEDLNSYDIAEEGSIYSMHMAEQGSEIFEKEKVYAQIQRINEYIKKLDEALQRINDKTYGICRVCGILIAKERLLAVPITTLSASYKIHKKCPEDGIDRIEPVGK